MHIEDLKLYMFNTIALVLSFSDRVESALKIILLLVSIAYTTIKIIDYIKTKRVKE